MASLKSLRVNTDHINAGAWTPVKIDGNEFEIRTRGITMKYRNLLHRLRSDAAKAINRTRDPGSDMVSPDDLPPSVSEACMARAVVDECFLDVRGLTHDDDGPAVTAAEFREMLLDVEQWGLLVYATLAAANKVTASRDEQAKAAEGNFATVSDGV